MISRVPLATLRLIIHVIVTLILVWHRSVVRRLLGFLILTAIIHITKVLWRIIEIWVSVVWVEVSIVIAIVGALSTLIHFLRFSGRSGGLWPRQAPAGIRAGMEAPGRRRGGR